MDLFRRQDDMDGMGDMGDMDMGDESAGDGVPGYFYMQRMFWVAIGVTIGFLTLLNLLNKFLLWQRLRSSNAKPKSIFWVSYASLTAMSREISFVSLGTYQLLRFRLRSPSLGKIIVVVSYLVTILVFCFYKYDTLDQWSWENIAYRCGCIAQAQLPLIFLLAGKRNIIGMFIGASYERLNWFHRWAARILWLTVTLHMAFFFRSWARYDYIKVKLTTDDMTQTGFAAWCILTAIVLTSFAPIRRWSYELFVIQHLVLFAGLVGAIMIHVDDGKIYIWISIAIYFLDRVWRFIATLFANLSIFHWKQWRNKDFWANKATLTSLPGNVTRITIDQPLISWRPGQHMFLSCHSVVPLQSHPFTVASLPSDGKMEFLVQSQTGGTRRFHRYASKHQSLTTADSPSEKKIVGIEGPYGTLRPLQQFDSIVFLAGSTGATFTTPLMRDIVVRWKHLSSSISCAVTKRIKFVWVIKSRNRITWFQDQLLQAISDVQDLRKSSNSPSDISLDITVYVTCDEELSPLPLSNEKIKSLPNVPLGEVQLVHSSDPIQQDTKKSPTDQIIEVQSLHSQTDSTTGGGGCMPGGGCCCKTTVEDENDAAQTRCCCCNPSSSSTSTSEKSTDEKPSTDILNIISGRPNPRTIIRKVLEEAEGESAVVVCGPQGLQDDVRRSVVALSDERAVHKGSGAQGVYLHIEGFCY